MQDWADLLSKIKSGQGQISYPLAPILGICDTSSLLAHFKQIARAQADEKTRNNGQTANGLFRLFGGAAAAGSAIGSGISKASAGAIHRSRLEKQLLDCLNTMKLVRPIAELDPVESQVLQGMLSLAVGANLPTAPGALSKADFHIFAIAYGGGRGGLIQPSKFQNPELQTQFIEAVRNYLNQTFLANAEYKAYLRAQHEDVLGKLKGANPMAHRQIVGQGAQWGEFDPHRMNGTFKPHREGTALLLGGANGHRVGFDDATSLVTIGPPGQGKSTCHADYNILTYEGSMVVLDIKGELYRKTHRNKRAQGFQVIRYAPDQEGGARYNPLDFIDPTKKEAAFLACRQLSELVIPHNPKARDQHWDDSARDVLTLFFAEAVFSGDPTTRTISTVLDGLSKAGKDRSFHLAMLSGLGDELQLPAMRRAADRLFGLSGQDSKQLDGFYSSVSTRTNLFDNPLIERSMQASDWSPKTLRDQKTVIYITVQPDMLTTLAPLLRMMLSQHIGALRASLPSRDSLPVTFFLDEAPQLGFIKAFKEAIETGRGYGIRLWLMGQSLGQFRDAYGEHGSPVDMCAVRAFMNLQGDDAKRVSDELGQYLDIATGQSRPLLQPFEFSGPTMTNKIIVLAINEDPHLLDKIRSYEMPDASDRLDP